MAGTHNEMHELSEKISGLKTAITNTKTEINNALDTKVNSVVQKISESEDNALVRLSQFASECTENFATKEEISAVKKEVSTVKDEFTAETKTEKGTLHESSYLTDERTADYASDIYGVYKCGGLTSIAFTSPSITLTGAQIVHL